ncbi:MAG: hypothetical protein E6G09_07360 [Actinobacteria bacterium]|nr:MAG: hypothetical protein E6G09_07360 [Actinomycetota bacterium]
MLKLTRWTIAHRRMVVFAWIVLAVGVLAASQAVGKRNANNFSLPNTDSQRAIDLLQSRFPAQAGDADQIVFRTRQGKLNDASARAVIAPLLGRIARLPHVAGVVSPYDAGAKAISKAGTIGFATVEFDQRANELPKAAIDRVINAAEGVRSPALQVELGGQAIKQAQQTSLGFATGVGLAAAVVVLLLSFGSLLAMGLPIVTALFGLGAGLGVIGLGSHLVDMVDFSSELALMIGLGVGIDYALFIVTRYRDAYRENGGDVKAALELAMNTALTHAATGIVDVHRQTRRARPPQALPRARTPSGLLDPLGRAHPALPRLGRTRIDGAAPPAGRTGTRTATRCKRLRQRSPKADDAPCLRPARRRLRQRLQRAAAARRPAARRRWQRRSDAIYDSAPTDARHRVRRRASAQLHARHRRDRCLPDHITRERPDDGPRQAPPRRSPAATRESNRSDRLRRRRDRDAGRLRPRPLRQAAALYRHGGPALGAPPARRLPVAADPVAGGDHESALDRGGARRRPGDLRAWLARGPDRRPARTDRRIHPRDGLRDRVRALDGLRGLPRLPHPRGVAASRQRERGRTRRTRTHRPCHHRCRSGHGRSLRFFRGGRRSRTQALRSRDGNRRLPRRDRHSQHPHARRPRTVRQSHVGLPEVVRPSAPAARDRASHAADTRNG